MHVGTVFRQRTGRKAASRHESRGLAIGIGGETMGPLSSINRIGPDKRGIRVQVERSTMSLDRMRFVGLQQNRQGQRGPGIRICSVSILSTWAVFNPLRGLRLRPC